MNGKGSKAREAGIALALMLVFMAIGYAGGSIHESAVRSAEMAALRQQVEHAELAMSACGLRSVAPAGPDDCVGLSSKGVYRGECKYVQEQLAIDDRCTSRETATDPVDGHCVGCACP